MSAPGAKSKPNRPALRRAVSGLALLMAALTLSSCGWQGISNMSIPGAPGSGKDAYTIYVQVPDTLALNGNSKVMVADVFVGSVREISLQNWVATLKVGLDNSVKLPKNATAKIGQTSLLGSQHVELAVPPNPAPQLLANGDTIPLKNSSAYPSMEQTLASLAMILRGGGIPNLEVLQNEFYNVVNGRAPQVRALLNKLNIFTGQLNEQRDDINHAIDSTNRLLTYVAKRTDVLDRALIEFPPLIKHFADPSYQRSLVNAIDAMGRLGAVTDQYLAPARANLHQDLKSLQCPLREVSRGAPYLTDVLQIIFSLVPTDTYKKSIRGDYINVSMQADLTYAAIDNALLTGTGLSGALRALEQSFGHDPESMIPDVRYTPNPNSAPGGPLVERGDRNC